jgi:hypothetical protein
MPTAEADRPAATPAVVQGEGSATIQWNETAAMAARRLRQGRLSSLTVMADGRPIGQIRLADIERCERNGNWLDAVMVHDLVRRPDDTCN